MRRERRGDESVRSTRSERTTLASLLARANHLLRGYSARSQWQLSTLYKYIPLLSISLSLSATCDLGTDWFSGADKVSALRTGTGIGVGRRKVGVTGRPTPSGGSVALLAISFRHSVFHIAVCASEVKLQ